MMERKRVVFVINNLGMGGAENMLMEQLRFLDRDNFEPYLITLLPASKVTLFSQLPTDVKHLSFEFRSIFDVVNLLKLIRFLKSEKIEAVVTNLFDANMIGRTAAVLSGIPIILSYEHNVYGDKRKWQIIVDRILARFTKKILVGSNEVLDFTSRQEQIPKDKFQLNFNSIPLRLGEVKHNRNKVLAKYGLFTEPLYIVTAGSLTPQKAHSYLLDAVYEMKQNGVTGFKLLIFGRGKLKDKLINQIKKLDLAENVKLMDIAPVEDIMAISDIFTLPSLWEGLSLALLEAMDAGCPIVATRVSGTNEALKDGVSGILVDPGDSSQLAKALTDIIRDSDLRRGLAQNAKENVKRFSIEKNVKVIENLILH